MALALVSCTAADIPDEAPPSPAPGGVARWSAAAVSRLLHWVGAAPEDALPVPDHDELDRALAAEDQQAADAAATALALRLARMHLLGVAPAARRAGWHITDTDDSAGLDEILRQAVASGGIDGFFDSVRPADADYAALRDALRTERDPDRRRTIALNMERWRWMPRSLGDDHVLVNTALFEAGLWRNGRRIGTWPVIVGKPSTPSPVFAARITGITFNPWWEIPDSIVREKHGRFPAGQGYVPGKDGWRQRPGPDNALGQMKLVMPNPYSVYLHDTPSRSLFRREVRAFSHGCIRVGQPLDLATALLDGARTRAQVDAIVASRQTATVPLRRPIPVYIAYFTAGRLGDGSLVVRPDIYGRDAGAGIADAQVPTECSR